MTLDNVSKELRAALESLRTEHARITEHIASIETVLARMGAPVKRGPGRPAKNAATRAMPARRGPGRPPKAAAGNVGGLDGLVAHVRGLERERDQLRSTIEKLRGLLDNV